MTPVLDVVPATAGDLRMLRDDPASFTAARGWRVEPGYVEFDDALDGGLQMLDDGVPERWAMQLFVHRDDDALIGLGGFKGAPVDAVVEIGYGIAPAYRRRGLATAAAAQMVASAARAGVVTVRAHTPAADTPSAHVLRRLGFARVAELEDPHVGMIWRWERPASGRAPGVA